MTKGRLEAFSDGVLAIIITIMVLGLQIPGGHSFEDLKPLFFKFLSYLFSFIYVGIYWNNHHHLFQATKRVNGKILWANLHLLFWLSVLPFATSWMGENNFAENPVALYGFVLLMAAVAFNMLEKFCVQSDGYDSAIAKALRSTLKEKLSILFYASGVGLSFVFPVVAVILYYVVAMMWIIPDLRIEKTLE
ncbi:TMEM175 family protein [Kaistella palustris]|uniref:TMEM175 family protein n=1 Tax=Kaistella palustris TaxID=493376 RepID=UPI00041A6962|nr:TMEM175 family protein [Kaistella palustris]